MKTNPFNIRPGGSKWLGLKSNCKPFVEFVDTMYGVRAGIVLLRNYIRKGYDTPAKIISRYAPATENNTENYINFVCKFVGVDRDERIANRLQFVKLCQAVYKMESGHSIPESSIVIVISKFKIDLKCVDYGN